MKRLYIRNTLAILFLLAVSSLLLQSCGQMTGQKTSFAIVIDAQTLEHTVEAVEAYRNLLESEGLNTYLLSEDWQTPEQIREELIRLYNRKPVLEGAVFIGNIPIPMIRDAQHLTTAFKLDQIIFPSHCPSVPSDRFYDDFDLKFVYLGPDEERSLYHYYSLTPQSAQRIHTNIYSGRIKPPVNEKDPYEQINDYLMKVVRERQNRNELNHLLTYAGHGYNSECLVAWGSERVAYREQLPHLFEPGNSYKFMYTHMRDFNKEQLLSEIQRSELDMAILSNHGGPTTQYLDGSPNVSDINRSIDNVKRFLRGQALSAANSGNDPENTIRDLMTRYGVPRAWFDGSFDPEVMEADSLFDANRDIYISDVEQITPNARFIKFDACYNGSFHLDQYIAGSYLFGNGKTIVTMGNTVNVLQDNWPIEMIGLLAEGVRIGNWARNIHCLENHIIGDPTFYFHADTKTYWNKRIVLKKNDINFWKRNVDHKNPDIQALSLAMLFANNYKGLSDMLFHKFTTSPFGSVRMKSLSLLHYFNDQNYIDALKLSVNDPYELIRRLGVRWIGMVGSEELVPSLVRVHFEDGHSKRVLFNSRNAAAFMPREAMRKELEKQLEESYLIYKEDQKDWLFALSTSRILADLDIMRNPTRTDRQRLLEIKTLRNYTYHFFIPEYVEIAANHREQQEIRLTMIEALGWFTHSHNRHLIIDMCQRIADNQLEDEAIRNEALKTLNRIQVYNK